MTDYRLSPLILGNKAASLVKTSSSHSVVFPAVGDLFIVSTRIEPAKETNMTDYRLSPLILGNKAASLVKTSSSRSVVFPAVGDLFIVSTKHFTAKELTMSCTLGKNNNVVFVPSFVCLFGLMLSVHGQQLRSCRDGQLSYPHCSWESLPEAGNQYLAHILSPLTYNCSS